MVIIQRLDYSLRGSISHLFRNFILYILKYHNNEDEYDELQSPMSNVFIVHLKAHPSPPSMDSLLVKCGILSLLPVGETEVTSRAACEEEDSGAGVRGDQSVTRVHQ